MNYITISIILLFCGSINKNDKSMVNISTGELVYVMQNNIHKRPTKNLPDKLSQVFDKLNDGDIGVEFSVKFKDGRSISSPNLDLIKDDQHRTLSEIQAHNVGVHCYDQRTMKLVNNFTNPKGKSFSIYESINHDEYEFTSEVKQIGEFTCSKAVQYEYRNNALVKDTLVTTIWYTSDVNLPFGPAKYTGFPGLVVKVEHKAFEYSLKNISKYELSDQDVECIIPNNSKSLSRQEYNNSRRKMNRVAIDKMSAALKRFRKN